MFLAFEQGVWPLSRGSGAQQDHPYCITKQELLLGFKRAFDAAITKSNIQGGFRGAGLVPLDPQAVISKPNVRLRSPPLPTVEDGPWQSETPSNTLEFGSQSKLIQEMIQRHVHNSLISIPWCARLCSLHCCMFVRTPAAISLTREQAAHGTPPRAQTFSQLLRTASVLIVFVQSSSGGDIALVSVATTDMVVN